MGVAGTMSVFTVVASRSVNPPVHKPKVVIAEGMMENIVLLPFAAEGTLPANGSGPGVTRSALNDGFDDDHLQTVGSICTVDGTPAPILAAYDVGVQINQNTGLTVSGAGNLAGAHGYPMTLT